MSGVIRKRKRSGQGCGEHMIKMSWTICYAERGGNAGVHLLPFSLVTPELLST